MGKIDTLYGVPHSQFAKGIYVMPFYFLEKGGAPIPEKEPFWYKLVD